MAWGNQPKRDYVTVDADFAVHEDGTTMELSRCVQDGELYMRLIPAKDEHGKKGKPVSMSLSNWERQSRYADLIAETCDKARQSESAIKLLEIHRKQSEADFEQLNGARKQFPDLFPDDVYEVKADAIKAKYPDVYPAEVKKPELAKK